MLATVLVSGCQMASIGAGVQCFWRKGEALESPTGKESAFMPELLLLIVIVVPVLAVGYVVIKWVTKVEQRALDRQVMERVYYPRRGTKADVPEFKWRSEPEQNRTGE